MAGQTFNFFNLIPAAGNNPSNDQPNMKTNNASTKSILNVDHYTFGNLNLDGWHKQMSFPNVSSGALPSDANATNPSVLYSAAGVVGGSGSNAQLKSKNHNATYLVNGIRAFGSFGTVNTNGAVTSINSMNVVSITSSQTTVSGDTYTIVLTTNAVVGSPPKVAVYVNMATVGSSNTNASLNPSWSISANTIVITLPSRLSGIFASTTLSFMILQA